MCASNKIFHKILTIFWKHCIRILLEITFSDILILVIFSYHLTVLWTFLTIFVESLQHCYPEPDSSEVNIDVTCRNTTFTHEFSEFNDPVFANFQILSLVDSYGHLRKDILKNITNLKSLMIHKSHFETFEPEANSLQYLHIQYSEFANHTNFDKCCKRLTKLLLKHTNGFFLEESVFKNLKRLQKLALSHLYLSHLSKAVFVGLSSLQKLRISDTNFQKIDSDAFADLTKLKELYIDEPNIQELDRDVFKPLTNLRVLIIINAANLQPLPLDMFSELKQLQQLGLPLTTWEQINIEEIPKMLPNLSVYSHSGNFKSKKEEKKIRAKFKQLNILLFNKTN